MMVEYLGKMGYSQSDLNALNVIHITGTKGKGSTCAFTDSILRHARPDWKVGLYISPHLVAVYERIRINGAPISEDDFARFFFEAWDRLEANETRDNPKTTSKPMYLRILTLVAFHAFLTLKVDATILEFGVGGTYNSTNIVPKPIFTGITALGIDHTAVLGKTLREVAWHKGGIYKAGVPAYTVYQAPEGLDMLRKQAQDLKTSEFTVVDTIPGLSDVKLGLAGTHQVQNANLAVHLARNFLDIKSPSTSKNLSESELPDIFIEALKSTRWPGRCQTVTDPRHDGLTWYLDGAHTLESLECCMQWFVHPEAALSIPNAQRILIFNCTNGRSGEAFLECVLTAAAAQLKLHGNDTEAEGFFDKVIFCPNVTYACGNSKSDLTTNAIPEADIAKLETQQQMASAWRIFVPTFPSSSIHVLPTIEDAVNIVRSVDRSATQVQVLVAGSLHLVGGLIEAGELTDVAI